MRKKRELIVLHKIRSRVFSSLVLKSTICISPLLIMHFKKLIVTLSFIIGYEISQLMLGKLKSLHSIMFDLM